MKTDINDSHVQISHDSLVFFSYTSSFSFLIHIVLYDNEHVSILNKEIESLKRQVELPSAEAIEWRAAYEEVKENLDKQMDTNDNIPEDEFAKLDEVIKHLDSEIHQNDRLKN